MSKSIEKVIIILFFISVNYVSAEQPGQISSNSLNIGISPRCTGMAGAYSAVYDDLLAIAYNPAGIVMIESGQICLIKNRLGQNIEQGFLVVAQPIREETVPSPVFASSVNYLKETTGTKTDTLIITLAYAYRFQKRLSLGTGLKFAQQMLDNQKANGVLADLGLLYQHPNNLNLGIYAQNLGKEIKFIRKSDQLPPTYRLGLAYLYKGYLFSLGTDLPSTNNDLSVMLGIERWIKDRVSIRCGYQYQKDNKNDRLNIGLGLKLANLNLDYGYQPDKDSGDIHQVALIIDFNKKSQKKAVPQTTALPPHTEVIPLPSTATEKEIKEQVPEMLPLQKKEALEPNVLPVKKEPVKENGKVKKPKVLKSKTKKIKLKSDVLPQSNVSSQIESTQEVAPPSDVTPPSESAPLSKTAPLKTGVPLIKNEITDEKEPQKVVPQVRILRVIQEANIYKGPGVEHDILTTIEENTSLILISDSNKWYYKVKLPDGKIGWVSYLYVE